MNPARKAVERWLSSRGPHSTPEIAAALQTSESTVRRAIRSSNDVWSVGNARQTRHAVRRVVEGVGTSASVFELTDTPRRLGVLHAVAPDEFVFEGEHEILCTPDLPWFLFDLRPAGYLGRQVPHQHPELAVPKDIHLWSSDHVLRYLTAHGHDGIGALVVGDAALLGVREPPLVHHDDFEALAEGALDLGPIGSSAAGEQPKFLARTDHGAVLVKFSPPRTSATAVRSGDLLIAEHIAHEVLRLHGRDAAVSHLHCRGERVYLEVERFDREGDRRRGQVMLTGLDAEFVGLGTGWVPVMEALAVQRRVSTEAVKKVAWRAQFGRWIANTDMHLGNQALWLDGLTIGEPTPVYDMLPMLYIPVAGEVRPRVFEPQIDSTDGALLSSVHPVALAYWEALAADARISSDFRGIASENASRLHALGPKIRWLAGT